MTLFDTETHEVVGEHQAPGTAFVIAFDPQGDSLAVAEDSSATRTLEILDAATGRVRSSTSLAAGQGFKNFGIVIYARTDEACSSPTAAVAPTSCVGTTPAGARRSESLSALALSSTFRRS